MYVSLYAYMHMDYTVWVCTTIRNLYSHFVHYTLFTAVGRTEMPLDRKEAYQGTEEDSLQEGYLLVQGRKEGGSHHSQRGRQVGFGDGCLQLGGRGEAVFHQPLVGRVRAGCKSRGKRCSLGCILVGCCPAVLSVAYWTD